MQFDADRFMSEANSTFISEYEPSENKSSGQRFGRTFYDLPLLLVPGVGNGDLYVFKDFESFIKSL